MLSEKLPGWKVGLNLDRYIRYGYLQQDDNDQLYLNWRTRAEVDEKKLIDLLLRSETQKILPSRVSEEEDETHEEDSQPIK